MEHLLNTGEVDPNKTVILDKRAVVVVTEEVYTPMKIVPKDSFGNNVTIDKQAVQFEIRKASGQSLKFPGPRLKVWCLL